MTSIQEINNKIKTEGYKIAENLKQAIKKTDCPLDHTTKTSHSKDVPSRPWLLTGVLGATIGIIGALSNNDKWPYIVGSLGIASIAVGISKQNRGQDKNIVDYDSIKSTTIEKCNIQLDITKKEWDCIMNYCKENIQFIIKSSEISEDKKNEYMSYTYYPETLDISTLELIDTFDHIAHDENFRYSFSNAKDLFAEKAAESVMQTVNKQISEYANINI